MIWTHWVAGGNALLIVAAGIFALARPPSSLARVTARAAALFVVGFGLSILAMNVAQLVRDAGVSWWSDFWWAAYMVAVQGGLLAGACGLVYAFRMRDDHDGLLERLAVAALLVAGLGFAIFPHSILGNAAPLNHPAGDLYRVLLPMTIALVLLGRLRRALRVNDEVRVSELGWTLAGFLPYAIYQGGNLVLYFPADDLVPALVAAVGVLLCLAYAVAAPVIGLRNWTSPKWHFFAAAFLGAASLVLDAVARDASPLWNAVSRDTLVAGVLLAIYQWHGSTDTLPGHNGRTHAPEAT